MVLEATAMTGTTRALYTAMMGLRTHRHSGANAFPTASQATTLVANNHKHMPTTARREFTPTSRQALHATHT